MVAIPYIPQGEAAAAGKESPHRSRPDPACRRRQASGTQRCNEGSKYRPGRRECATARGNSLGKPRNGHVLRHSLNPCALLGRKARLSLRTYRERCGPVLHIPVRGQRAIGNEAGARRLDGTQLTIHIGGTTELGAERGIATARAMFDVVDVLPFATFAAATRRNSGEPVPTDGDLEQEEPRLRHAPDEPSKTPLRYSTEKEGRLAYILDETNHAPLRACRSDRAIANESSDVEVTRVAHLTTQIESATHEQVERGVTWGKLRIERQGSSVTTKAMPHYRLCRP